MHPACIKKLKKSLNEKPRNILRIIQNLYTSKSLSSLTYEDLIRNNAKESDYEVYGKDLRINHLEFSDFRTYPSSDKGKYCVDFSKDDSPSSLILVGQNGTGKSTLFTALELISIGRSSFAREVSVAEDNYLTFSFKRDEAKKDSTWSLIYKTGNDNKSYTLSGNDKESIPPLSVPAFVCSDLDIARARKADKMFRWILRELGYEKIDEMISALSTMITNHESMLKVIKDDTFLTESDKWELIKAINDIQGEEDIKEIARNKIEYNVIAKRSGRLFNRIWKEMSDVIRGSENGVEMPEYSIGNTINQSVVHRLVKLYNKLSDIIPDNVDYKSETWKFEVVYALVNRQDNSTEVTNQDEKKVVAEIKNLKRAKELLIEFEKEIVWEFISNYGHDIEQLLKDFSSHNEHYQFENSAREYIENLSLNIRVNVSGDYNTVPKEYFNTFRYKLFVQTMKMALAFNWMKETGIAAPVVIDDVFNASDFENSIKLESYIYFVKRMYRKICFDNDFQFPLQLVMLTHDDIVFNSVINGFNMVRVGKDCAENRPDRYPFIKGRLYKLEELSELYNIDKTKESQPINVYIKEL